MGPRIPLKGGSRGVYVGIHKDYIGVYRTQIIGL